MEVLKILAIDAVTVVIAFTTLWAICASIRDVTMVDAWWALGMALLAVATFVQMDVATDRRVLLSVLCAVWAVRLGGYLFWRWRDHGPDRRYVRMMEKAEEKRGWSYARASFWLVFVTQAPLQFIVALPVMLGQIQADPVALGPLAYIGAALAVFGIVFESIGDWQLTVFRKNSANAGQVLQTGLWRYTRHPNYFGDACVWWGLFLIGAETPLGWLAIPGPILLTWTLMKWSGAPTLEFRMRKTKPGYAEYIARTSGFVPWPPKRV
jgi:steroid 5-alpha reductase family enzyme